MKLVLVLLAGALGLAAASASAAPTPIGRASPVVLVQTNEPGGNHVVVYDRSPTGVLSPAGIYSTGGNGGAAAGAPSDKLASQGSLLYDRGHDLLIGVNAGSDSVYAFGVNGDRLSLSDVVPSGGEFPVSVAVRGNLLYVLNAGGNGNVNGFRIAGGKLHPLPGSTRSLGLGNTNPPNFLTSPGQVGFTPDGSKLIVTTKASTSAVDVFAMDPNGRPSAAPVVNPSATPVPFAFTFQPETGRLVDGEAGASSVTTYAIANKGTLADPRSLSDGQAALCWITRAGDYYYVSNTGSNTVSGYRLAADGTPSLVGPSGVVATTEPGTIDSTAAGSFLYVQTGIGGTVDEFRVKTDGSLMQVGTVTGLPPGMEGIAAS